jgi:hypothetical protein
MNRVDVNSSTMRLQDSRSLADIPKGAALMLAPADVEGAAFPMRLVAEAAGVVLLAEGCFDVGAADTAFSRTRSMIAPGLTSRTCDALSAGTDFGSTKVTSAP